MRIAVSNPDNIGDFILRQPMLAAFQEAGHELLLIVRDFVAPLAIDLFPEARVLRCLGNPYGRDFSLGSPLGQELLRELSEFAPDLFVVASYQHTQMEELLVAELPGVECIGFTGYLYQARPETTAISAIHFVTRVSVGRELPELEKNQLLCEAALGHPVALGLPQMTALPAVLARAGEKLSEIGLNGRPFWAVCAGDAPDKGVRNWRVEQWAEFCRDLTGMTGATLLFIGSPGEHDATVEIQSAMGQSGLRTATITGETMKLDMLTAILHLSEGYIGKDTGPMHIAAALGKPVLGVFGGGTWPRFVPAATTGGIVTLSVPCVGCDWVCHLSRSHCVKDVPVATVLAKAVAMVRGEASGFSVEVLKPDPILEARILRDLLASVQIEQRKVAAERANFMQWHDDRLRDIAQLRGELDAAKIELGSIETLTVERNALVATRNALVAERNSFAAELVAERDASVAELVAERNSFVAERNASVAELVPERAALVAERDASVAELVAERAALVAERAALVAERDASAAERKTAVEALAARTFRIEEMQALEERAKGLAVRTETLEFEARLAVSQLRQAAEEKTATERFRRLAVRKIADARHNAKAARVELDGLKSANVSLEAMAGLAGTECADWKEKWKIASARLEEKSILAATLQVQVDTGDSRYEGIISDQEQLLKRRSTELASALELIPDLREELAAMSADLALRDDRITHLERTLETRARLIAQLEAPGQEAEQDHQSTRKLLEITSKDLQVVSEDHAARLVVIESLGKDLAEANRDRQAKQALIEDLLERLEISDADRDRRLDVIEMLSGQLAASEKDRASRLRLIENISARLEESEQDRTIRLHVIEEISARLEESEQDRTIRLHLIEDISARLEESEQDRTIRLHVIEEISARLEESEQDRTNRLHVIEEISARLEESEQDRLARLNLINSLAARLAESEKDREKRLQLIQRLSSELGTVEVDRASRGGQIEKMHEHSAQLQAEIEFIRNLVPYRILKKLHIL